MQNDNKICLTILLPVYNGYSFLQQSIKSVLSQSFTNFELLIVDDGSTDKSVEYLENLNDERISFFQNNNNKGLFYNLNFLINKSRSGLLKLWAQDDIMLPECLQKFYDFHRKYPQVGFSFSGREMINEQGVVTKSFSSDAAPSLISTLHHARVSFFTGSIAGNIANVCINKNAIKEAGLFNESMKISGDFEMLIRLAEKRPVGFIPQSLVKVREHKGQLSLNPNYNLNHVKEDLQAYRILIGYSDDALVREGRKVMRQHKLVFYYTLMVKDCLKGRLSTCWKYYKELSSFDNFLMLTISFIKAKLKKPPKPSWI